MPLIIRNESEESVATRSSLTAIMTVLVVAAAFLVGYFAWWVPSHSTPATIVDRQTVVHDQAVAPSTIVVTPPASQPPTVIQGQAGPKGDQGAKGDPGTKGDNGGNPPTTTGE